MDITGKQWGMLGLGGASMLPMLFADGDDGGLTKALSQLEKMSTSAQGTAKSTREQGQSVLGPVVDFLKSAAGGDQATLNAITQPERRRIIDQYDAAKKATAITAPRGGGYSAAVMNANAQEASDLGMLNAMTRTKAVDSAASLGTTLTQQALSADQLATQDISALIQTIMQKNAASGQNAAAFGEGIASLIATVML